MSLCAVHAHASLQACVFWEPEEKGWAGGAEGGAEGRRPGSRPILRVVRGLAAASAAEAHKRGAGWAAALGCLQSY